MHKYTLCYNLGSIVTTVFLNISVGLHDKRSKLKAFKLGIKCLISSCFLRIYVFTSRQALPKPKEHCYF